MRNSKEKGITLVALVVTIVVLLILATISVSIIFSDNGIIKSATDAKNVVEGEANNVNETLKNMQLEAGTLLGLNVIKTHNFADGILSNFYKIEGNLSNSKGTITVPNIGKVSSCLKMESSTKVTFKAPCKGFFKLYLGPVGGNMSVKINGTTYTSDTNGVVDIAVDEKTEYVITKGSVTNIFYMDFRSEWSANNVGTTTPPAEKEPDPTEKIIHNFDNGKTSDFFTITGTLSTSKGTLDVPGVGTISQCLKIESSTSIVFTPTTNGKIEFYFKDEGKTVSLKANGTTISSDNGDRIVTTDLVANTTYTFIKGNTGSLFCIVFTPSAE